MRRIAAATIVLGALGFAAPAIAGPGQCYDAYGRPIGPVYDTDNPNYGFINSVIRRGGSCTGVQPEYNPNRGRRFYYDDRPSPRYYRDRYYDEGYYRR